MNQWKQLKTQNKRYDEQRKANKLIVAFGALLEVRNKVFPDNKFTRMFLVFFYQTFEALKHVF